ncbi:hypothetical protein JCM24511_04337 [Saitozyma sp. JCM 24511]|nr:hypothetical protein JCM24511_04337 [Saitozyma sp. JCM 24511]
MREFAPCENGRPTRVSFPSLRGLIRVRWIRQIDYYAIPSEEQEKYNWSEEFGGQSFIDGDFTYGISEWPCNWLGPDNQVAKASSSSTATAPPSSSAPTVQRAVQTIVLSDGTKLHPEVLQRLSSRIVSSKGSVRASIEHPADGVYRLVIGDPTKTQNVPYVDLIDTGKMSWAYGSSTWSYHTFIPKAETEFIPADPEMEDGKRGGKWVVEEVRAWPKDEEPVVSSQEKESEDSEGSEGSSQGDEGSEVGEGSVASEGSESGEEEDKDGLEKEDTLEAQEGPGSHQAGPVLDPEGEIEILTRYIPREATLGSVSVSSLEHRSGSERGLSLSDLHIHLDMENEEEPMDYRVPLDVE